MKLLSVLVFPIFILTSINLTHAEDWQKKLTDISPKGVQVTEVTMLQQRLKVHGHAASNVRIAAFMRSIDNAGIGTIMLDHMEMKSDGRSHFDLTIRLR